VAQDIITSDQSQVSTQAERLDYIKQLVIDRLNSTHSKAIYSTAIDDFNLAVDQGGGPVINIYRIAFTSLVVTTLGGLDENTCQRFLHNKWGIANLCWSCVTHEH